MSKFGVLKLSPNSDYFCSKTQEKRSYNEKLRLQFGREEIDARLTLLKKPLPNAFQRKYLVATAGCFKELGGFTRIIERLEMKDYPFTFAYFASIVRLLDSSFVDFIQLFAEDMVARLKFALVRAWLEWSPFQDENVFTEEHLRPVLKRLESLLRRS